MKYLILLFISYSTLCFSQRTDFTINFKKADSIALNLKGESLQNLPILTHKLTASLNTDVEKFRAIYFWVCTNIENDYYGYLTTVTKRKKLGKNKADLKKWNIAYTPKVFKTLLVHKKTNCTGYAYLIRELAALAGLKCKIINGYGKLSNKKIRLNGLPNHSWNAIELNNKWYLCDATWSTGKTLLENGQPRFVYQYFDGYFLSEPSEFIKTHFPLKEEWTLLTKPPTFTEFLEGL